MLLTALLCSILCVALPLWQIARDYEAKVYKEKIRHFRLTWVQKAYPPLKNLSWDELEREYPIRELYDRIH